MLMIKLCLSKHKETGRGVGEGKNSKKIDISYLDIILEITAD